MKINISKLLTPLIVLLIGSCNSRSKFDYFDNKGEYQEVVNCLHQNISMIFTPTKSDKSVSFYEKDFNSKRLCNGILKLMGEHSIDFVVVYKDSTIAFYAKPDKGLKERQFILMFANERRKVTEKITSDIKIINEKNDGCYELEKTISLAN